MKNFIKGTTSLGRLRTTGLEHVEVIEMLHLCCRDHKIPQVVLITRC